MDYWQERSIALKQQQIDTADVLILFLKDLYSKTSIKINKDILYWYSKFAVNNKMSLREAKIQLNKSELEEFKWSLEEYTSFARLNGLGEYEKQLVNASARVHVTRLETLKTSLNHYVVEVLNTENNKLTEHLKDTYTDNYNRRVFDIQQKVGMGKPFEQVNPNMVDELVKKPWTNDKLTYSQRIWGKHQTDLKDMLNNELSQSLIKGEDSARVSFKIVNKFKVKIGDATRLVQTESAYIASMSDKSVYEEMGVKKFIYIATLDNRTSDTCIFMDNQIFPIDQYRIGKTVPPLHPNCRSTTGPYDYDVKGERIATAQDDSSYFVPADMNYEEWRKQFPEDAKNIVKKRKPKEDKTK